MNNEQLLERASALVENYLQECEEEGRCSVYTALKIFHDAVMIASISQIKEDATHLHEQLKTIEQEVTIIPINKDQEQQKNQQADNKTKAQ